MPVHRITNADDVRTGNAKSANRAVLGVPTKNLVTQSITPVAADADGYAVAQAVAGAGNLTLNGALAGVADVPRNVQIVSTGAGDTTQTATFTGTDEYGSAMQERLTFNGVTPVLGLKAFKRVTQIAISAALAGNGSAGTGIKLGLAFKPVVGGFIRGRLNEDSADTGTYVAPIRTVSTLTTADVRGTYAPAGTLDGTNVYVLTYVAANGPSDEDGFGIAQFNG